MNMKWIVGVITIIALLCAACTKLARQTVLRGEIEVDASKIIAIKSIDMPFVSDSTSVEKVMIDSCGMFKIEFDIQRPVFKELQLITTNNGSKRQFVKPLFMEPGEAINLTINDADENGMLVFRTDNINNRCLHAFGDSVNQIMRNCWFNAPEPKEFRNKAESIIELGEQIIQENPMINEHVVEYIQVFGYNSYMRLLYDLPKLYQRSGKGSADLEPDYYLPRYLPNKYLDNKTASLFKQTSHNIRTYLLLNENSDKKGLFELAEDRISQLESQFKNEEVIQETIKLLLLSVKGTFWQSSNFEKDLASFTNLSSKIEDVTFRNKLISEFSLLRYSLKGTMIPDVTIENRNGDKANLSSFKGKVIYIDFWASWCKPCCKEIPFLKDIEKKYHGQDITFISISIDKNKEKWIEMLDKLKLDDNQFHVGDSRLQEKLGIKGIPHFVIYDAEGNLFINGAPRPSSTDIHQILDEMLMK